AKVLAYWVAPRRSMENALGEVAPFAPQTGVAPEVSKPAGCQWLKLITPSVTLTPGGKSKGVSAFNASRSSRPAVVKLTGIIAATGGSNAASFGLRPSINTLMFQSLAPVLTKYWVITCALPWES